MTIPYVAGTSATTAVLVSRLLVLIERAVDVSIAGVVVTVAVSEPEVAVLESVRGAVPEG